MHERGVIEPEGTADATAEIAEATGHAAHRSVVEVGWLLVGTFDTPLDKAMRRARALFVRQMREAFPELEWQVPLVLTASTRQPQEGLSPGVEPVALLDVALQERELRRWDFAIAFYAGELRGYARATPLGAPSAAIGCAVAGAQRLWEPCDDPGDRECQRRSIEIASRRAAHLGVHLLGHLAGLGHAEEPHDFMYPPHAVTDLDTMSGFSEVTAADLREELLAVADPRLEEENTSLSAAMHHASFRGRLNELKFALIAAWQQRDDVRRIVKRIRPWQIPLRLGRLVAAAASPLVVFLITAEVWEAGMTQPLWRVAILGIAALVGASTYLISKQRLLVHRPRAQRLHNRTARPVRLSEQRSVGNVAIVLAVLIGMGTLYVALFAVALGAAWLCYPMSLVHSWAASVEPPITFVHYLRLAGSVAALGLGIGALGASFEPRGYVRHVAYVDEEV